LAGGAVEERAAEEDEEEPRGSNGAPRDFTRLEQVFPGLVGKPVVETILAPVDGFLGISAVNNETDLAITKVLYLDLIRDIKQVDSSFKYNPLLPANGIDGLSHEGRTNLLDDLRMERAAAYYRIRGDVGYLQVETLRFLRGAVDVAYANAVSAADAGRLRPRLSREEAIGNRVDAEVRQGLKSLFNSYGIPFGPAADVAINSRDYETSEDGKDYRIPDARLREVAIDWTLSVKMANTPQIRGFFRADVQPRAVVIIRPSQLGGNSMYLIRRPPDHLLWR
jgi:hypothetical protein